MPDEPTNADIAGVINDISILIDSGIDTSDVGTSNGTFNAATVMEMTGASSSNEAAAAGHAARDDMAEAGDMGIPSNRHS